LVIDRTSGLVLRSEQPKQVSSLEEAVRKEQERKARSDEMFAKAFADEKERKSSLEEKFRAALESKDELETPVRPIDWD
jgi:predicted  nucleic acid-binding Zn-ribbon protein